MAPDIFAEITELKKRGERAALAIIISRHGSTPRHAAAKMLVFEDGRTIGTIGGGCVEAEVCAGAQSAIRSEKTRILSFDLTEDDAEESGLICGGKMEVYVEPILPDPTLFIFGAGHVGCCLAEIAKGLGFRIAVVDDRVKYANTGRFPSAESLYVGPWEEVLPKLPIDDGAFLIIATRGHKYDLLCLKHALQSPARYVGLLGSRRKTALFMATLEKEGVNPFAFERVYAPVGLEIGSETPEEIAVSIAAELVAVRKRIDVRSLRSSLRPSQRP